MLAYITRIVAKNRRRRKRRTCWTPKKPISRPCSGHSAKNRTVKTSCMLWPLECKSRSSLQTASLSYNRFQFQYVFALCDPVTFIVHAPGEVAVVDCGVHDCSHYSIWNDIIYWRIHNILSVGCDIVVLIVLFWCFWCMKDYNVVSVISILKYCLMRLWNDINQLTFVFPFAETRSIKRMWRQWGVTYLQVKIKKIRMAEYPVLQAAKKTVF